MEDRQAGPPDRGESKARRLREERALEQQEGLAPERRGSAPAPSDRPENHPPHPQDVNEVSR